MEKTYGIDLLHHSKLHLCAAVWSNREFFIILHVRVPAGLVLLVSSLKHCHTLSGTCRSNYVRSLRCRLDDLVLDKMFSHAVFRFCSTRPITPPKHHCSGTDLTSVWLCTLTLVSSTLVRWSEYRVAASILSSTVSNHASPSPTHRP